MNKRPYPKGSSYPKGSYPKGSSYPRGAFPRAAFAYPKGPKPLADLVTACVADAFARQGFTSCEIVTHWDDIVGADVAALAEPVRMQWAGAGRDPERSPCATLVLRVDGPAVLEVQYMSALIIERVNSYFGWRAVARLSLRQAPLTRRPRPPRPRIDEAAAAAIAARLTGITDGDLRAALGRLGAASTSAT